MLMGLGWVGREMQCLVVSHLASEAQTFQSAVGQVQRDSGEAALLGDGAGLGCFGWSLSHTPVKGHQGGRRTHLSIYFAFLGNRHFKRQCGEKHSLVGLVCWLFVAWEARVSAFILAPLTLKSCCLSPLLIVSSGFQLPQWKKIFFMWGLGGMETPENKALMTWKPSESCNIGLFQIAFENSFKNRPVVIP